jgi:predicted MFS family arabinose efflux permease
LQAQALQLCAPSTRAGSGLPHIAEDFKVSIATAAGFAAVFAFTFSIIQPLIGDAARNSSLGQTVGPLAYGLGLAHGGKVPTLVVSAAIMVVLGLVCARLLKRRAPADARV